MNDMETARRAGSNGRLFTTAVVTAIVMVLVSSCGEHYQAEL
jgi:hypothetical protein